MKNLTIIIVFEEIIVFISVKRKAFKGTPV